MPASEADNLCILQIITARRKHSAGQHARMVVVDDVQSAVAQIHAIDVRQTVYGQHRNMVLGKQLRQIMIDQRIILIRSGRQYNRISTSFLYVIYNFLSFGFETVGKFLLCRIARRNRVARQLRGNAERLLHVLCELAVSVLRQMPMKQRRIKRNAPSALRIIGIANDNRIAFDNRAHGFTGFRHIFTLYRRDRRHENAVYALFFQIAQMSVHELRRKTCRIRGDGRQAVFIHRAGAAIGHLYMIS